MCKNYLKINPFTILFHFLMTISIFILFMKFKLDFYLAMAAVFVPFSDFLKQIYDLWKDKEFSFVEKIPTFIFTFILFVISALIIYQYKSL